MASVNELVDAFATKIQSAWRKHHSARLTAIDAMMPDRMKCPITKCMMTTPAIASDGVTYEYRTIEEFLRGKSCPCKGPMGIAMPSAALVLNRALIEEINDFCVEHHLKQEKVECIPAPPMAPTSTFTPAPRATTALTTTVDYIMQPNYVPAFTLGELFTKDGFLHEIRKPGLCLILEKLRLTYLGGPSLTKPTIIWHILQRFPTDPAVINEIVLMLDNPDFIKHLTVAALDCVLYSLGCRATGNHQHKVNVVHRHLPLTVTIKHEYGAFPLTITRSDTTQSIYARAAQHLFLLKLGDEVMIMDGTLSNYTIKDGTVIENRPRHQFRQQPSMGSAEYHIFVLTLPDVAEGGCIILVVKGNDTIESIKVKILDKILTHRIFTQPDDIRIIFGGKQIDDTAQTLSDCSIVADCEIKALPRLRGGMAKKGVKKTTKDQQMHLLRAKFSFGHSKLPRDVTSQHIDTVTTEPSFIMNSIKKLGAEKQKEILAQLDGLNRSSAKSYCDILEPYILPQITALNAQKAMIDSQIASYRDALGVAFASEAFQDSQYDYDGFYNGIEKLVQDVEDCENERAKKHEVDSFVQSRIDAERAALHAQFQAERAALQAQFQANSASDMEL